MQEKFKAPQWFIKLNNESEKIEDDILSLLSEKVGYSKDWCDKNRRKAFDLIKNEEDKNNIISLITKREIIKKYGWNRFYYTNWKKIKKLYGDEGINGILNKKQGIITVKPFKNNPVWSIAKGLIKKFTQK